MLKKKVDEASAVLNDQKKKIGALEEIIKNLRKNNINIEKENANIKSLLNEKQLEIEGKSSILLKAINSKEIERNSLIVKNEEISRDYEEEKKQFELITNKSQIIMDIFAQSEEYLQTIDKLIYKLSEQVNVEVTDIDEEGIKKEKQRHLRDLTTLQNLLSQLIVNEDSLLKQKEEYEDELSKLDRI